MKLRSWIVSATRTTSDQPVQLLDDDPAELLAEVAVVGRGRRALAMDHLTGVIAGVVAGVRRARVRRDGPGRGVPRRQAGEVAHRHRRIGVVSESYPVDQVVGPQVLSDRGSPGVPRAD